MKFSIVIPLRAIGDYTLEAIPHYLNQTFKDFEIIIVSEADEKQNFPKTRIIKVGRVPPAEKRNQGVKAAKGDIIAFIDDDAYPAPDWLENAARDFKDNNIVAIGGSSLVPQNATFFQRVSNKVYELSSGKTGIRYGKHKQIREIDDWPTCNFLVRKKDFEKVGGFDSKYWGGEDTQLCYSLIKTGKKMIYDPELIIYHHPRKTIRQHLKQTYFWGMWRGFFTMVHKQSRQLTFFVPAIFTLWLILGGLLSIFSRIISYAYMLSLAFYVIYLLILGIKAGSFKLFLPVIILTFLSHISYGLGFLKGIILNEEPTKKTLNPAENTKFKNK